MENFKNIFVLICAIKSALCCYLGNYTIYYQEGNDFYVDISLHDIYNEAETFQLTGPINQSQVISISGPKYKRTAFYYKLPIVSERSPYYLNIQGRNFKNNIVLFAAVKSKSRDHNYEKKSLRINITGPTFCKEYFDTSNKGEKPYTFEEEVGRELKFNCEEIDSELHLVIKGESIKLKYPSPVILKMTVTEYDNNTYIECVDKRDQNKAKTSINIKIKPPMVPRVEIPKPMPTYEEVYKYFENETYNFTCDYRNTVYWIVVNEDNDILDIDRTGENSVKKRLLTRYYHNSILACVTVTCVINNEMVVCTRQILKSKRFQMKNEDEPRDIAIIAAISCAVIILIVLIIISWRYIKKRKIQNNTSPPNDNLYDTTRVQYAELELTEAMKQLPKKEEVLYSEIAGILTPRIK